jgi:hypothetical protein
LLILQGPGRTQPRLYLEKNTFTPAARKIGQHRRKPLHDKARVRVYRNCIPDSRPETSPINVRANYETGVSAVLNG